MPGKFRAAKWSTTACIRLRPTPWFCTIRSTEIGPMPAICERWSAKLLPQQLHPLREA